MSPPLILAALVVMFSPAFTNPVPSAPLDYPSYPDYSAYPEYSSTCTASVYYAAPPMTVTVTYTPPLVDPFRNATSAAPVNPSPAMTTPPPVAPSCFTAVDCQPDNCLRQVNASADIVAPFCATYTTTVNNYTTGLPDAIGNCAGDVAAISSACSCVFQPTACSSETTTSTTPPAVITPTPNPVSLDCQADNCLRQMQASFEAIVPFCATYTTAQNTYTTGLPTAIANCAADVYAISSACSCILQPTPASRLASVNSTSPTSMADGVLFTPAPAPPVIYQTTTIMETVTLTMTAQPTDGGEWTGRMPGEEWRRHSEEGREWTGWISDLATKLYGGHADEPVTNQDSASPTVDRAVIVTDGDAAATPTHVAVPEFY